MSKETMAEKITAATERREKEQNDAVKELEIGRAARDKGIDLKDLDDEDDKSKSDEAGETKDEPKSKVDTKQAAEQKQEADGDKPLTVEERLDLMDQELELRDLKLQKMENRSSKWEGLAQRRAGELDFIRKQSNSRTEKKADDDIWSDLVDDKSDEVKRSSNTLSEFEEDALVNARQDEQLRFLNVYEGELYTGEGEERQLDPEFVKILTEVREDYQDELASSSPKRVRKATQSALKEARLTLKEYKLENSIVEARKRRAIVSNKARERKLTTQASESSASTSNDTGEKSIEDMTAKEMAEWMSKDPRRTLYQ